MTNPINQLTRIPFRPDPEILLASVHLKPGSPDAAEFLSLLDTAIPAASPKAVYRECYLEDRTEDTVRIDGVTFRSRTLRLNLEQAERVFAFVATCGTELDAIPLPNRDFLTQYWLDAIKAEALHTAIHHLHTTLENQYALGNTGSMSPGSGDISVWQIEQQAELFSLLGDGPGEIGVQLTDSFLMVPNKTVSGMIFPTEKAIRTCQVCKRENCPSRQAAFDLEAWQAIQQPASHGI